MLPRQLYIDIFYDSRSREGNDIRKNGDLRTFVVRLPDEVELARLTSRVREAGLAFEETSDGILVRDLSQNCLLLALWLSCVKDIVDINTLIENFGYCVRLEHYMN